MTTSGIAYSGTVVSVSGEAILLRQPGTPHPTSFALDTVVSVATPTNALPAFGGLLVGGLLGAAIGYYGAEWEEEPVWISQVQVAGSKARDAAVAGALIGGAVGGVRLALLTAGDSYNIGHPTVREGNAAQTDSTATQR